MFGLLCTDAGRLLFLMGKKRCRKCEHEKAERDAARLMDSWLCVFDEDVWCPHSDIPKKFRLNSVCFRCEHMTDFVADMEAEESAVLDDIEDIRRNPRKYGYSGGV